MKNRLGEEKLNNEGYLMKIIKYTNANDIIVEFQDANRYTTKTSYGSFKRGTIKNWMAKVGEENYNHQNLKMKIIAFRRSDDIDVQFEDGYISKNKTYTNFKRGNIRNENQRIYKYLNETNTNFQGCVMKIIEYNSSLDIKIEFQDKFKTIVNTNYHTFKTGGVKNPYFPSVYDKGISGNKYSSKTKEYDTWHGMLRRCYDEKILKTHPTYQNVTCCEEWLLFDNFYEWLHSQENFDKWYKGKRWNVDKDILIKGNKVYSPDTCCLVPGYINNIFTDTSSYRGDLPKGVSRLQKEEYYEVNCNGKYIMTSINVESAFNLYKEHKERYIKKVAKNEYDKDNITKRCYEAMMNYQVEITD